MTFILKNILFLSEKLLITIFWSTQCFSLYIFSLKVNLLLKKTEKNRRKIIYNIPKQSPNNTNTLVPPFPVLFHAMESHPISASGFSPIQEAWCHGVGHCLGHTPSLWTHVRPGATAGGLKNQLRSPPSAATIGAAARRLGKVWQLKSIQGSVKHRPCVLRLTHQWGGGDGDGRERERNMFGLQISQNIGCDPRWGVRKKTTSCRGDDDDDTPKCSLQISHLQLMFVGEDTTLWARFLRD